MANYAVQPPASICPLKSQSTPYSPLLPLAMSANLEDQASLLDQEASRILQQAQSLKDLATAWRQCSTTITNAPGTNSYRQIIALIPDLILRALYTTTWNHLSASEEREMMPIENVSWHTEAGLGEETNYRNPLYPLQIPDLNYSIPEAASVRRYGMTSVLGLISCLSQDETWEWEAYLELHRRAILDWSLRGQDANFEAGGSYSRQMRRNSQRMRAYDGYWGIKADVGGRGMHVWIN